MKAIFHPLMYCNKRSLAGRHIIQYEHLSPFDRFYLHDIAVELP